MSSHGIEVEHLRVVFGGDFVAVDDVSFKVAPGESFGIVGESGSGKSTVLRAICGLAPRQSGTVRLLGGDGGHAPGSKAERFSRKVQMVFQDPYGSLHPRQTVDRILAEPLAIHGIGDAEARIERALDARLGIRNAVDGQRLGQDAVHRLARMQRAIRILKHHLHLAPIGLAAKRMAVIAAGQPHRPRLPWRQAANGA